MTRTVLRLRTHEVWSALEVVDPVAVLAEDLIGRIVDRSAHVGRAPGRVVPWRGSERYDSEFVLLDHPRAGLRCVMPAHGLRNALVAALAAVAAHELLLAGGVTVAVVGSDESVQPQLSVIARHVPDISHVALCLPGGWRKVEPKLADQLELSGIGLSVVPTLAEAVFGANLVVAGAACQHLDALRPGQLARGAVLVNGTGKDLPADLVDQVNQVFVDDIGLLDAHLDRRVVAAHLAPPVLGAPELDGGFGRRITADLSQLLTGRHAGRVRTDDLVLVELLGVDELNAELAYRIFEGAMRTGLGERIAD
jgi:ornithine cyclodeaminase/alanine dehydrogenase-like protein (mu-crystallin family)